MVKFKLESQIEEYQRGYLEGYKDALSDVAEGSYGSYKAVNRPSDGGKSKAWMNMPEGTDELPKSTMADDLKRLEKTVSFISDHMVILQGHLCDVEKRIERLEDGK